jgi:hypothetical protein
VPTSKPVAAQAPAADGKPASNVYDYGGILGYKVNVQLREGEKLTRNWFNKGLHINMDQGDAGNFDLLKSRRNLGFQQKLGDLAPGRVGNGTLEYDVPMADGKFRLGALTADNLDAKALRVADAAKSGVLVIRMPSSYVYLGGELSFKPVLGEGGSIAVSFSDNNGLDWKPLANSALASAPPALMIAVTRFISLRKAIILPRFMWRRLRFWRSRLSALKE